MKKSRMKPPCPMCGEKAFVRTLGGGSTDMYRYKCDVATCLAEWQQIPLVRRVSEGALFEKSRSSRIVYLSHKCNKQMLYA